MPNVKDVKFDRVHDLQFIFRQLLDVMARPGRIGTIASSAAKLDLPDAGPNTAAALALTLLDGEVSFAVAGGGEGLGMLESYVRRQTFSQAASVAEADYVFAAGGMPDGEIRTVMSTLRCGTLQSPEQGATLFLQVAHLGNGTAHGGAIHHEMADNWMLQGPGIQDTCRLSVGGLNKLWFAERFRVNAEYPMGIDIVLFTPDGQIAALPRTTTLREEFA